MKRTLKLSLLGALIVIANQLNATSFDSSFNVNMVGTKAFEMTVKNLRGDVKISLLNSKKGIIYKENFVSTNRSFQRTFDLGLFPDGNYTIELLDEEKSQSIPLSIEENKLYVKTIERAVHFLPMVFEKDNMVRVHMPVLSAEYLDISILNESDEIMYEAELKGEKDLGKIFDFSKSYKGSYKFLLGSNAGFVTKEIVID